MPTGFSVFGNMPVVQVAATVRELTQQNGVRSSPRPSGAVETRSLRGRHAGTLRGRHTARRRRRQSFPRLCRVRCAWELARATR
jgi:hypothetical protein